MFKQYSGHTDDNVAKYGWSGLKKN